MIKLPKVSLLIIWLYAYATFGQNSYHLAVVDSIGTTIEQSVAVNDKTYINDIFHVSSFAMNFLMATENAMILEFNTQFVKSLEETFDIGELLVSKGDYRYVRAYLDKKNKYHLVFRLYSEDGINYHDYELKQIKNEFRVVDVYIFYTGRKLSDAYYDRYMEMLTYQDFFNMSRDYRVAKRSFDRYVNYIRKKEYKKAYITSGYVAEEKQATKPFKLLQLKVAQHLPEHVLNDVLKDFKTNFPDDPSLHIRMIDYYFMRQKYEQCLASVEQLNNAVEGDPFLDIYRGNIHFAMGELEIAKEYFVQMVNNYPNFVEGYDLLFAVYIALERNDKAVEMLNAMMQKLRYTKSELIDFIIEQFPNFTKTSAYQDWQ